MDKRKLFAGLIGLCTLPIASTFAQTKQPGSATFTVPSSVKRIRVRSWKQGRKVLDREMSVEPGQTFRIDPV
jgi:hypothetical protein